ncbi:Ig-like domain-containing protein, partial [Psychrobacter sanguinis]|uniref:Ig-like domain-containing protein n=1 Tax=Psychrobacter sanguinis TaxID=861445 RepID=UPI001396C1FA
APDTATATVGDTTAPDAPSVDSITNTDTSGNGDPDTTTISGTAEAGATVIITDSEGNPLGQDVADENGNYEIEVPALAEGERVEVT